MAIVRNELVLRRAGLERELERRVDQRVLRMFGNVERIDEYSMAINAEHECGQTDVTLD